MASAHYGSAGWILVGLYASLIVFFVWRGARKTKSVQDYALGSMAFSPAAVGLSLAAAMTSAATFIINPGFVAHFGLAGFISMGVALPVAALLSLTVLTKGFRRVGKSTKALTMAQWMSGMYGSPAFGRFMAFMSLLLLTFIVLITVGITNVLASLLVLPKVPVAGALIVFVFGYMMFGGANSMVYTNVVQALIMIVVAVILITSGLGYFSDGFGAFLERLRVLDPVLASPVNPTSPLFRDYFEVIVIQVIIGIAIVCQPHIITKSLLLNDDKSVNRYLVVAVGVEALFFVVVFAGLYARLFFAENGAMLPPVDGVMSAFVVQRFGPAVGLLVIIGLISAGLSTLEGLIQSLSTTITQDIIKPLAGSVLPSSLSDITLNRMVIVALAAAAFVVTRQQLVSPDLSVGILAQNGVYAYFAAAFVPVLFGIFVRNAPLAAVASSAVTAAVVHFAVYYGRLTPYMETPVRNPAIAAGLAIIASFVAGTTLLLLLRDRSQPLFGKQDD
jgi:sodium/pantothenate symporter